MTANMESSPIETGEIAQTIQEKWFSVTGDLDDFIFYGQDDDPPSER